MSLNIRNLAKRLFQRFTKPSTLKVAVPNRARLNLEAFEDRTVPTVVTVTLVGVAGIDNAVEGGVSGLSRFTRTDTTGPLTVYFDVGGTATEGSDYTSFPWEVTFADGVATVDVPIVPIDDSLSEPTETVIITVPMYSPSNYYVGASNEATVTIADDDAPVVTVEASPDTVAEGDSGAFRLTRFGDLSNPLTVNIAVGGTATSGTDFTAIGTTVTFAAGEANAFLDVETLTDNSYDANETLTITIESGTGYQPDLVYSATITIEEIAVVTVEKIADATEGGASGVFRFTRTGGDTTAPLMAFYSVDGTATPDADYAALSGYVLFAANETTADVTVSLTDDTTAEPDETVEIALQDGPHYVSGTPFTATLVAVDNELPEVSVYGLDDAVEGGDSGAFRLVRAGNLSQPLTVNFVVSGTATPTDDYTQLPTSATFAANEDVVNITVIPVDDGIEEETENVSLALQASSAYAIGVANTANINLVDNIAPPPHPVGSGTGLFARYYNNKELYDLKTTRIDAQIKFYDWHTGNPPETNVGADNFSVQWVGQVQAQYTENYTFHAFSDDGVRLWVNDRLIIDQWNDHSGREDNSTVAIPMQAEQKYAIKMEYYEHTYSAHAELRWSSASQPKQFIPQSQLYPVVFDLDVNANGSLFDTVDGANDYLPGYEGNVQKVSTGNSFNTDVYTGQRMKLVLDGVGTSNATKVEFVMTHVSKLGGYASNKSADAVGGANTDEDFSFYLDRNTILDRPANQEIVFEVNPSSVEDYETGPGANPVGGVMEANKTWVNFYVKDYGASARLEARVYVQGNNDPAYVIPLTPSKDENLDGFADKWQIEMGKRWATQYGVAPFTVGEALARFNPAFEVFDDAEEKDPDGTKLIEYHFGAISTFVTETRPLPKQKETGDAHTLIEEYRGYILDGGGFDNRGNNGHSGGHIRLDPARKEILVEVDRVTTLNHLPAIGLAGILNGAAKVFSQNHTGAGIYMYYLFDGTYDLPADAANTNSKLRTVLGDTRNPALASDFLHLLFMDSPQTDNQITPGITTAKESTDQDMNLTQAEQISRRGSVVGTTAVYDEFVSRSWCKKPDEPYMTAVAHELLHQLFYVSDYKYPGTPFVTQTHTISTVSPESIMNLALDQDNYSLALATIIAPVQRELRTRTGSWGTYA